MNKLIISALPLAFASLTACISTTATQVDSTPLQEVYPVASVLKKARINGLEKNLITDLHEIIGVQDATISMSYMREPIDLNNLTMTDFNGQQVIKTPRNSTIVINGIPFFDLSSEEYTFPDTFIHAGSNTADYDLDVITSQFVPPKTAVVGSSGKLYEGYSTALEDKQEQTAMHGHWSLEALTDNTANLCEIEEHQDQGEGSICHIINKQGDILKTEMSGSFIIVPGEPAVNFVSE